MKLSELMAGKTPNPAFAGLVVNDNMVLAINADPTAATPTEIANYSVLQMGMQGVDPQLNPQTQDNTFIRQGTTTTKTGQQRSFALSGARYVGDAAQDFMFSHGVAFGIGEAVVTDYVYFNILTGLGEKGRASVIVNSDGGGNAGENSAISVDIKQSGSSPVSWTYTASINEQQGTPVAPIDEPETIEDNTL